ncbi:MAG: hypothetical protein ACQEXJ_23330 [Myxococcota bacterium]
MSRRHRCWRGFPGALATLLVVTLAACGGEPEVFIPPAERSADLPDDPGDLVALADRIHEEDDVVPARVDRALAALEKALDQGPEEPYEVLWRLARAGHRMAGLLETDAQTLEYVRAGRRYAERAVERRSDRVEGHYYLALNMARIAEASGDAGLLKPMMPIAKKAGEIAPAFEDAGPLRLMGKVYMVAPEWPANVGDREAAVETLKEAVSLAPTAMNRLFLGQAFYHAEEYDKAEAQLRRALRDAEEEALDRRWVEEAEDYLRRLGAAR